MEQIILGVIILVVALAILVQNGKLQTKIDDLKREQERHNNIQMVILDQIDKIATNVGVV
jgi:hypothetical protein